MSQISNKIVTLKVNCFFKWYKTMLKKLMELLLYCVCIFFYLSNANKIGKIPGDSGNWVYSDDAMKKVSLSLERDTFLFISGCVRDMFTFVF